MNEDQLFNELKTSIGQAIAYAEGNSTKARKKTVAIKELATFSAQEIKDLRLQMNLTQKSFAALMGVSIKTIEAWERGTNHPSGAAARLLEILKNEPHVALPQHEALSNPVQPKSVPGCSIKAGYAFIRHSCISQFASAPLC